MVDRARFLRMPGERTLHHAARQRAHRCSATLRPAPWTGRPRPRGCDAAMYASLSSLRGMESRAQLEQVIAFSLFSVAGAAAVAGGIGVGVVPKNLGHWPQVVQVRAAWAYTSSGDGPTDRPADSVIPRNRDGGGAVNSATT